MNQKKFITLAILFVSLQIFSQGIPTIVPNAADEICPILIGKKTIDINLTNINGSEVLLSSIISSTPSVLIFYRGGWCPYCNAQLGELQLIEQKIIDLGYQIIAISPDVVKFVQETKDAKKLNYSLYSDSRMEASKAFGIAFKVPENRVDRMKVRSGNNNPGWLPVPSVFVLDTDGIIKFEHINPDYKTRLNHNVLLAVLTALKE